MIAALPLSSRAQALADDRVIDEETINPSETCVGITNGGLNDRYLVYAPHEQSATRPALVVFLGGATSRPRDYTEISAYAARMGYGVLNLSYETGASTAGLTCGGYVPDQESCYTNYRGETIFGANQPYRPAASGVTASASYNHFTLTVAPANSIVNRLVCALQYLVRREPTPETLALNNYFGQFLTSSSASPYPVQGYETTVDNQTVVVRNRAYPDWSKIILVGHSTGAASAAFLSMHLPVDPGLKRVVVLSGPNDNVNLGSGPQGPMQPAEWIYSAAFNEGSSRTPMDRFWALRHEDEGNLGEFTSSAWNLMGGVGVGIGAVGFQQEFAADNGGVLPNATNPGRHKLRIQKPENGGRHSSTTSLQPIATAC